MSSSTPYTSSFLKFAFSKRHPNGLSTSTNGVDLPYTRKMDNGAERKSKKAKASPTVFTFGASHAATKVQLLSHHTLHHLCAMFCKHTTIGDGGEGVHDHMWNIVWQGRCYESGDVECMSESGRARCGSATSHCPSARSYA